MWGTYVQGEIDEAESKSKDSKEARRKVKMVIRKLLKSDDVQKFRDPGGSSVARSSSEEEKSGRQAPPPARSKYKDPMSVIRTGG